MTQSDPLKALLVDGKEADALWDITQALSGLTQTQQRSVLIDAAVHFKLITLRKCRHVKCSEPVKIRGESHCPGCKKWCINPVGERCTNCKRALR